MTDGGPDWIRDALRQTREEIVLFLRTAAAFTFHPRRFASEWVSGGRRALNPLGFLATAFAVLGPLRALFLGITGEHEDRGGSFVIDALSALLPFAFYVFLGAIEHGVLRLFGSRRPLRDSVAMALYAGGGPAAAITVLMMIVGLLLHGRSIDISDSHQNQLWVYLVLALVMLAFSTFCFTLSAALGGVHPGTRWWQILIANLVALAISGLLFGWLHPPGSYGLHVVLHPYRDPTGWHFNAGLQD